MWVGDGLQLAEQPEARVMAVDVMQHCPHDDHIEARKRVFRVDLVASFLSCWVEGLRVGEACCPCEGQKIKLCIEMCIGLGIGLWCEAESIAYVWLRRGWLRPCFAERQDVRAEEPRAGKGCLRARDFGKALALVDPEVVDAAWMACGVLHAIGKASVQRMRESTIAAADIQHANRTFAGVNPIEGLCPPLPRSLAPLRKGLRMRFVKAIVDVVPHRWSLMHGA